MCVMVFGDAVNMLILRDSAACMICAMHTLPCALGSKATSGCKADKFPCHEGYSKPHATQIGMTAISP